MAWLIILLMLALINLSYDCLTCWTDIQFHMKLQVILADKLDFKQKKILNSILFDKLPFLFKGSYKTLAFCILNDIKG